MKQVQQTNCQIESQTIIK